MSLPSKEVASVTNYDALDLRRTYVSIEDEGAATPVDVTPDFWPELISGQRTIGTWLMGANHRVTAPLTWDLHPRGECVVCLLSGAVDIVLRDGDRENVVELRAPGAAYVVPRGTWHRQVIKEPSDVMFLTAGRDTRQRPVEPTDPGGA
jgi:hypothetical protein